MNDLTAIRYLELKDRWMVLHPPPDLTHPLDHGHPIPDLTWLLEQTTDWDSHRLTTDFQLYVSMAWGVTVLDNASNVILTHIDPKTQNLILDEDPTYPLVLTSDQGFTFSLDWTSFDKNQALPGLATMWTKVANILQHVTTTLQAHNKISSQDAAAADLHIKVARQYQQAVKADYRFDNEPSIQV